MSGLIAPSWLLIYALVFLCKVLTEAYEENLASHMYVVGKRSIIVAFSDNCTDFSFTLFQNLIREFLKLQYAK